MLRSFKSSGLILVTISLLVGLSMVSGLAAVQTFTAESPNVPIAVPEEGASAPYPSTIQVSGLPDVITDVTVTLSGVTHYYPDDLDILLVGPEGQNVMLWSGAGSTFYGVQGSTEAVSNAISNITVTFDDSANEMLPDMGPITGGTYQPTDYDGNGATVNDTFDASFVVGDVFGGPDVLPSPAPAEPHGTTLSVFDGTNPNGTWSLFVFDDYLGDGGSITGWSLTFASDEDPTIQPMLDQRLVPNSANGAPVDVSPVVADDITPTDELVVSCVDQNLNPFVSGQLAPLGTTTIICTVTDGSNQTASTSFAVEVLELGDLFDELQASIITADFDRISEWLLLTQTSIAQYLARIEQPRLSCFQLRIMDLNVRTQQHLGRIDKADTMNIHMLTQQIRTFIGCDGNQR